MAIISNTTKLMTVFSGWTIQVPLSRSPCFGIRDAKDPEAFRGGPRERVNSNVQPTRS
jgi:hypothetical protein